MKSAKTGVLEYSECVVRKEREQNRTWIALYMNCTLAMLTKAGVLG